jgi:hypothetical protein
MSTQAELDKCAEEKRRLLQAMRDYLTEHRIGELSVRRAGVDAAMEWILSRAAPYRPNRRTP